MKLVALDSTDEKNKSEFSVKEISFSDLGAPSKRFLEAVENIESLKSINSFTLDQFKGQIGKQFEE